MPGCPLREHDGVSLGAALNHFVLPSRHLACRPRISELLDRNADDLVLASDHLSQVDVVNDVVLRRHRDRPAWAFDLGALESLVQVRLVVDLALDRIETNGKKLRRVVALYGVDVRLATRLALEGLAECDILGVNNAVKGKAGREADVYAVQGYDAAQLL